MPLFPFAGCHLKLSRGYSHAATKLATLGLSSQALLAHVQHMSGSQNWQRIGSDGKIGKIKKTMKKLSNTESQLLFPGFSESSIPFQQSTYFVACKCQCWHLRALICARHVHASIDARVLIYQYSKRE
jgi:hypothetical protein